MDLFWGGSDMSELTCRKEYSVHAYETDFRGRVRLFSLMNYLQDAAGEHAAALGFSVTDLGKKHMTWVLSRYHLRVARYPVLGERLIVETWPSGRSGYFALRDFDVRDKAGRDVLCATTSWMVIDFGKKQPVKVDEILPSNTVVARRALADDFKSLPALDSPEREVPFRVEMGHIDLNRHVNHAVYVQWAIEAVPPDVLWRLFPLDIEIAYRGEAVYGDEIRALVRTDGAGQGSRFLHQIVNAKNGAELTRLRTLWGEA
jgi:medium-chain acyl-[acyl-carrier-protein] hydrolase